MMKELLKTLPQIGTVDWIGIRPERKAPLQAMTEVRLSTESGLEGDHYRGTKKKRQVTLIQGEHLEAVASILGRAEISPNEVRRNIVIRGINLLALKDKTFKIGAEVVLATTGLCHPCSRMEQNLGPGGYNAMRGHGGITASVEFGGMIAIGDEVSIVMSEEG